MKKIPLFLLVISLLGTGALSQGEDVQSEKGPSKDAKLLPQRSGFHRVLRDYLATLTAKDFELPQGELVYDEAYLDDKDNLFKTWLVMMDIFGRFPQGMWDIPPEAFTLAKIESKDGVRLRVRADLYPASLLWWADWDYPGNPFKDSVGLRNRVLALCIVDMLMLDSVHIQDTAKAKTIKRADFLGGSLIWMAMAYDRMKDQLPEDVRKAYEEGLNRFVDRLISWGPGGGLGNMDCMGLVSMAYIAKSVDDKELAAKAEKFAKQIVDKVVAPAGYLTDGGGTDLSYNGLGLYHVAWAARLSGWLFLEEATQRMLRFKALLSFPDPDGTLWSPSHFTFRTSAGPANDQWGFPHREYGLALGWPDIAGYLLFEGQRAPKLVSEEKMRDMIRGNFAGVNKTLNEQRAKPKEASVWSEEHFDGRRNWAEMFYKLGEYALLREWESNRPPRTKLLIENNDRFFENLDNELIFGRFPDYAALLHVGHVGVWHDSIGGFGGGAISTFWTPSTGSVILSRRRGFQHENPDRLDEWRIWPTHALSGLTKGGKMFTSAGVRFPKATNEQRGADTMFTRVEGSIGANIESAPDGALSHNIDYRRDFLLSPAGLEVDTTISGSGMPEIGTLFEILPVFLRDAKVQPDVNTEIFFVRYGKEEPASEKPVPSVSAIRIKRFDGSVRINLDRPRTVSLSPESWKDTYQTKVEERNVMIDATPSEQELAAGTSRLKYQIQPGEK